MLPIDLINRSYGRLVKNCPDPAIGLLAAYVGDGGHWFPSGRAAMPNPAISTAVMDAVADHYNMHASSFFETLKYPPEIPYEASGSSAA
jgi:hypothetical protein